MLSNVTPAVAVDDVEFDNELVLLHCPLALSDMRVQMVVPSLSTLLSDTTWERLGDVRPIFGAVALHDSGQDLIFLPCPCAFGKVPAVVQLEPARVAFDLRLTSNELTDTVPGVLAIHVDITLEFHVLKEEEKNTFD